MKNILACTHRTGLFKNCYYHNHGMVEIRQDFLRLSLLSFPLHSMVVKILFTLAKLLALITHKKNAIPLSSFI